uniref:Uncharacterized protein n=1 Tax=Candidatus Kentrum sp. DK TaxID=2126562 RepID=A0A450SRM1_9GAMM|nr:MAG: hypothetical protein BECKDK2373C_GA0170839_103810 [Candidatus Kentron sp. DK]VFJ56683.1 MAG: hypothetical protein BECKDK2373B_GA0170837_106024 [Candidatus Kentron sp. DK]
MLYTAACMVGSYDLFAFYYETTGKMVDALRLSPLRGHVFHPLG